MFKQEIGDLGGKPFLYLGPSGKTVHNPGKFGKSYDPALLRDICDMGHTNKRQQMVLAHGI